MNKKKDKQIIRILHYIGSLNIGGSQTMIMELYRKIDKNKIQFDFIVDRKNELFYKDEIIKLGGKVYIFDDFYKGYNHYKYIKQWSSFFKIHNEYKIIHCHVRSVASIVLKIAKKYGLKTIIHSHSTSNGKGCKALVKKILQSNICKYSDYLFACSKQSAIWLYGKKRSMKNNCYIINNSIDSDKYCYNFKIREKLRKELNISNKIVIGQVGRLASMKNHLFSLKVLKECLNINSNYYLIIVGDGPLRQTIEKEICNLNLKENVLMLGNRGDVYKLLQAMDFFIMPSLFEGLPLSLIEAQAASLMCFISKNVYDGILEKKLVERLGLESGEQSWAKIIDKKNGYSRIDTKEIIKQNNFDSKSNAEWISAFYQKII